MKRIHKIKGSDEFIRAFNLYSIPKTFTMKLFITCMISTLFLFSCQIKEQSSVQSKTLLETTKSLDGNLIPEINGQPKVTISKVIIPPKKKLPKHIHPVITAGILQKGELTVTTENNEQLVLKAGDVLIEVSNTIHFGENTGETNAEILVFYIGEENMPVTILKND